MSTQRIARLVVALLAGTALAGCGGGTSHTASSGDDGAPSATLPALQTKLRAITVDECATRSAAEIYPTCARFVREVQNVVPAARAEAGAVPSAAALTAAADTVDAAVNRFARDQCVAVGGPSGAADVCGPDLAAVQQGLGALVAAVGR